MRWPALLAACAAAYAATGPDGPFEEGDRPPAQLSPNGRTWLVPPLPPGPPPTGALDAAVERAVVASLDLPLGDRMTAISSVMLGVPYAIDPLGEGAGHDDDPLARYDAYDCLTFVEEVLALALSGDPAHAGELRKQIRYGDAPIAYGNRRHFMELQWLPGNVADGLLVDTTARYGRTTHLEREVTAASWRRWGKRSLFALTDAELPVGTMALDVLSLDDAATWIPNLPDGAIVLTVRADNGVSPLFTTHLGFVVRDPTSGAPAMRNASRRSAMRVIDEDLAWYAEHLKSYKNWPVAGIAVFEPIEQGPRRGAAAR